MVRSCEIRVFQRNLEFVYRADAAYWYLNLIPNRERGNLIGGGTGIRNPMRSNFESPVCDVCRSHPFAIGVTRSIGATAVPIGEPRRMNRNVYSQRLSPVGVLNAKKIPADVRHIGPRGSFPASRTLNAVNDTVFGIYSNRHKRTRLALRFCSILALPVPHHGYHSTTPSNPCSNPNCSIDLVTQHSRLPHNSSTQFPII